MYKIFIGVLCCIGVVAGWITADNLREKYASDDKPLEINYVDSAFVVDDDTGLIIGMEVTDIGTITNTVPPVEVEPIFKVFGTVYEFKIGDVFTTVDREENPFQDATYHKYTILAVKDGWVQYKVEWGGLSCTNERDITEFVKIIIKESIERGSE